MRRLYKSIYKALPKNDGQIRATVKSKINKYNKELSDQEMADTRGFSAEDISIFKKTLSFHDDVPTLLDGAAALKELGLNNEAIAEYKKLLEFDYSKFDYSEVEYSPVKIICDYLDCLLDSKTPQEVVKEAYKVTYKHNLKEAETAQIKFWLGSTLEKRDLSDLAYELYETAAEIDPANREIQDKFESIKAKISSSSRYDYLLRNKIVTTKQLKEALAIAKKKNKSVEFLLVDRFGMSANHWHCFSAVLSGIMTSSVRFPMN